jgi:hypothetical protein
LQFKDSQISFCLDRFRLGRQTSNRTEKPCLGSRVPTGGVFHARDLCNIAPASGGGCSLPESMIPSIGLPDTMGGILIPGNPFRCCK